MLLFAMALLGLLMQSDGLPARALDRYVGTMLPDSASALVNAILGQAMRDADPLKLSFALVFTWWSTLLGMRAVMEGLNAAYEVAETRPWWRRLLVATGHRRADGRRCQPPARPRCAWRLGLDEGGLPWVRAARPTRRPSS